VKVTEHWTVIYNPTSGTYREDTLERIQRALRDAGVRSEAIGTSHAGHATELSRALTGTDRVACYSGDGTLNEVATGLIGRNLPIAFLPGGTANVMAHELGLPRNPVRAALALLRGRPRPVRPGVVGGRYFLLMAGLGFDATAVSLVSPRMKAWAGRGAYVWAGARALCETSPDLRLTGTNPGQADDRLTARWVVAARARRYGGPFVVNPWAGLEAPTLGIAAIGAGHVLPFLVANLGLGESRSRNGRWLLQATGLVVEAERPVHLQVDGDYRGQATRFEIRIAEQAVQLCFPAL